MDRCTITRSALPYLEGMTLPGNQSQAHRQDLLCLQRYHMFYQHVIGSSSWNWGLVWGHASSPDLVHWEHEPIAIEPSAGEFDSAGCWSGNVAIETDGTPTMLYTGVR